MLDALYQWVDLLWLPLGWFAVAPRHRWYMMGFIFACIMTLRLQVELMGSVGLDAGLLRFWDMPLMLRGMLGYGFVIGVFTILAHFSKKTMDMVFMAASIGMYIFAFCFTMILMLF